MAVKIFVKFPIIFNLPSKKKWQQQWQRFVAVNKLIFDVVVRKPIEDHCSIMLKQRLIVTCIMFENQKLETSLYTSTQLLLKITIKTHFLFRETSSTTLIAFRFHSGMPNFGVTLVCVSKYGRWFLVRRRRSILLPPPPHWPPKGAERVLAVYVEAKEAATQQEQQKGL